VKGKGNERWKKEEKTAKSKTVFKISPPLPLPHNGQFKHFEAKRIIFFILPFSVECFVVYLSFYLLS